ncbi:hypothetical protein BDY21DRAFT_57166 [Lineolata rhizophorae]|uniref:Uncharacterized protein n=1 Tax=Lineolata rhizophorae TaxID=578093 RepID=A0A6A6NWJ4_9PEZI|nr:hypothetical protein BDY21DRAFT_57166 [Lineolata rhizophorae]
MTNLASLRVSSRVDAQSQTFCSLFFRLTIRRSYDAARNARIGNAIVDFGRKAQDFRRDRNMGIHCSGAVCKEDPRMNSGAVWLVARVPWVPLGLCAMLSPRARPRRHKLGRGRLAKFSRSWEGLAWQIALHLSSPALNNSTFFIVPRAMSTYPLCCHSCGPGGGHYILPRAPRYPTMRATAKLLWISGDLNTSVGSTPFIDTSGDLHDAFRA